MNIKNNEKMHTVLNVVSGIASMLISFVVGFFLSPYIVENLGAEANGFIQLANNFVVGASLISVAVNSMGSRFISVSYNSGEINKAKEYYSSLMIANFSVVLVLVVPSILLVMNLDSFIQIPSELVSDVKFTFLLCFANYFVSLISGIFVSSTFVKNKLYISNTLISIVACINAIFTLVFFVTFDPRVFYVGLIGLVLNSLSIIPYYLIKRKIMPEITFSVKCFNLESIKTLLQAGVWNTVNHCGILLMTGLDLLAANIFLGPTPMGILNVAKSIPTQIINLAGVLNYNLSASLVISEADGNNEQLLKNLNYYMKVSSVVISIPIMVFTVFGLNFYRLWQPTLDENTLLILSFFTCLGFIPTAGTQTLYNVFTVKNKLKFNSIGYCINGVVNIIVVVILLSTTNLGVYAIAVVSSVTDLLRTLIFILPYTAKLLDLKWYTFYKNVGVSLLCAAICGVISFSIRWITAPDTWVMLIIGVGISCVLCLLVEIRILLNKNERATLLAKIKRK